MTLNTSISVIVGLCMGGVVLAGVDGKTRLDNEGTRPAIESVEQLTQRVRKSVVVISVSDPNGQREALGTGFVVDSNGLIATNLHVIGRARPIQVRFEDGQRSEVTSIHASDRILDLALLKVDRDDLPAIALGDSDDARQGQDCIAMGNPRGLEHSVVRGVVSGIRQLDGRKMIQIAIPIEEGNSGGPLIDREGRVIGILTIKSAVTANLGFAVTVNDLKRLIETPNPIPIARWLKIGALDPQQWKPLFGARWQQRGGRISVSGSGKGFGGRALCLAQRESPEFPYEIAVTVRLGDETGAAGLIFHSDGDQRHYGFYPSNGRMRFSRFDGPNVFSWNVLEERFSEHYRPGAWNHLKVRFEPDGKMICFVNDHIVFESQDDVYQAGQFGLAKFRHTTAEFRDFVVARDIPTSIPAAEDLAVVDRFIDEIASDRTLSVPRLDEIAEIGVTGPHLLRERAKQLEADAKRLRSAAKRVHAHRIISELAKLQDMPVNDIDLVRGSLLIASLDDEDIDRTFYTEEIGKMANEMLNDLPPDATSEIRLRQLNKYLYQDNGFHGSRADYYHPANSYLNRVIDDREGIPITLSVLYMELGRRLDLNLVGVGLPGHFMVALVDDKDGLQLIDAYDGGKKMTNAEAARLVFSITGRTVNETEVTPADHRSILVRILHNLLGIAEQNHDVEDRLRYLDALLAIDPMLVGDRGQRVVARVQSGDVESALQDLDWFLEHSPEGVDIERIRSMRDRLATQNK